MYARELYNHEVKHCVTHGRDRVGTSIGIPRSCKFEVVHWLGSSGCLCLVCRALYSPHHVLMLPPSIFREKWELHCISGMQGGTEEVQIPQSNPGMHPNVCSGSVCFNAELLKKQQELEKRTQTPRCTSWAQDTCAGHMRARS